MCDQWNGSVGKSAKPGDLSSIDEMHIVEGENPLLQVVL